MLQRRSDYGQERPPGAEWYQHNFSRKAREGRDITTDVLLKICEALNCNINEIMESESEPGDEKKVLDTDPVDVEQKSDTESVKR